MISQIDKLKAATNLHSFAHLLGYKPKALAYIIYGIPDAGKYISFDIKKKGGGVRTINSPTPKLKELQHRLAKILNNCLKEIDVLNGVSKKNKLSHGFVRKYSICSNASKHTNKRWVFNIDLEDFFKNINFGRVRGYFIKNKHFCLNETVATIIAQISCHKNELPQGAPTSPVISNLIGSILDIRIASLARKYRCTYSRYADDITLSTNKKEFPNAIGFSAPPNNHTKWSAGSELEKIIHHSRFKINNNKTRMLYCRSQQNVTGIVVNEKVNISNIYLKFVRSACDYIIKGRAPFIASAPENIEITSNQIRGMLSHIFHVKNYNKELIRSKVAKEDPSHIKTYRKFLDYIHFASKEKITIICEGKTDNIYIKCALNALKSSYPNLHSTSKPINTRFNFFKYTKTTHVVQRLNGGTGDIADLIFGYDNRIKELRGATLSNPVIIIVDNDQGSKAVFAAISNKIGVQVTGKDSYYHVTKNIYVIPTPLPPGLSSSMIEDMFDKNVLATELNGKTFNPNDKTLDTKINYSKALFAEHVVRRGAVSIDFSGFKPIINSIDEIISKYKPLT